MTIYSLENCSEKEKDLAKEFIKKAVLGFIAYAIESIVEDLFKEVARRPFAGDDKFTTTWAIETLGNDLIAAIGATKNEIDGKVF